MSFTIDLEYEKQVDLLLADDEEEEKEINLTKKNLEIENYSNWSATSILMMNNLFGTIPEINNNKNNIQQVENEDRTSTNTNVTSSNAILNNPSSSPTQKKNNYDNNLRKLSARDRKSVV